MNFHWMSQRKQQTYYPDCNLAFDIPNHLNDGSFQMLKKNNLKLALNNLKFSYKGDRPTMHAHCQVGMNDGLHSVIEINVFLQVSL